MSGVIQNGVLSTCQDISLSFTKNSVPPVVHVKQYERRSRKIRCTLFSGKAEYSIPSNITFVCSGTRPDGGVFIYKTTDQSNSVIDKEDNKVLLSITEYMTDIAGEFPVDITLTDSNGDILRTFSFILSVEPCAAKEGKALTRPFSEALSAAADGLFTVFITEDGYFAINTDDGTIIPTGTKADIVDIIHSELVDASINNNGIMSYETASRYGLRFGMTDAGEIYMIYREGI